MKREKNRILIPYMNHDNITNIYYEPILKGRELISSNYFSTGLYERDPLESAKAFSMLAEPLVLYDEVFITYDDFLYLTTKI